MPEKRKHERTAKSQLGQFFTPNEIAEELVNSLELKAGDRILEPGCGDGSFVIPLIRKMSELYTGTSPERAQAVLENNIYAIELDESAYQKLLANIEGEFGLSLSEIRHNLYNEDFLVWESDVCFTHCVGNPPFGGTISYEYQDKLDKIYGRREGLKIKKESYSFFIVKCLDHLCDDGVMRFICSDTFLTIKTMSGLRQLLMNHGSSTVSRVEHFSDETTYPMVVFDFEKTGPTDEIRVFGEAILRSDMESIGNFSWTVDGQAARLFRGKKLSDYIICSSGMTTGKNEYFVRKIKGGKIEETFEFEFFDDPITLKRELERARLNKMSDQKKKAVQEQEARGETRRNVRITPRETPLSITIPDEDYLYYNMAESSLIYAEPKHVIYWKDDGDAVYTFKKNGNWYLHGVGGKPYFRQEGFTWPLIASRIHAHYLPSGYILDSGAPCGFLKEGVPHNELFFIIGWCASDSATKLLKKYINHTKNIQGKDVERLPYPSWVGPDEKQEIICMIKSLVNEKRSVDKDSPELLRINEVFDTE